MIATKEEVQAALSQYHPLIRKIIDDAWAEWRAVEGFRQGQDYGAIAYKRTISNYMFDGIARRAIRVLGSLDGIHVKPEAQTVKFFAGGKALFRFKKGDDAKLGCNIPTEASLAFIDADRSIPGLPPETAKVEVIWQPNEIWTQIERELVIARDGDRLIWEYDLDRDMGGAAVLPFPTPIPPAPADDEDDLPVVKPKPITKPDTGSDKK